MHKKTDVNLLSGKSAPGPPGRRGPRAAGPPGRRATGPSRAVGSGPAFSKTPYILLAACSPLMVLNAHLT